MFDTDHQEQAHAQGWRLVTTVDHASLRVTWDIAKHGSRFSSDREASVAVVDAARRGSTYHQNALQLVIASRGVRRKK